MLRISTKYAYGRNIYVPEDGATEQVAKAFGQKTFTDSQLKALKQAGLHIEMHAKQPDWLKGGK